MNTNKPIGIIIDQISVLDSEGVIRPLLKGLQFTEITGTRGPRQYQLRVDDIVPDLVMGPLEWMIGTPLKELGSSVPPVDTETHQVRSDEVSKDGRTAKKRKTSSIRGLEELLDSFGKWFDWTRIADSVDGDPDEAELQTAIGLRKQDATWESPRTFLFTDALEAPFPDRSERRLLLKHFVDEDVVKPNTGRKDTLTVAVQVAGRTRKAYRLNRGRLKALLPF